MTVKERAITVRVVKKIQESEFEPFEIHLEESVVMDDPFENPRKLRKKLYKRLKNELDNLIDERITELEDA